MITVHGFAALEYILDLKFKFKIEKICSTGCLNFNRRKYFFNFMDNAKRRYITLFAILSFINKFHRYLVALLNRINTTNATAVPAQN